ncbi:MAG: cofactor-independent phosphoglycerate mutase [Lachnospiraceae bacterium]|nr:cofactor-independent phosphoglycerate mutase [Lachnospiraceae bacterium]
MKYIVMLGDGMADYPVPELNNKTPLEVANKPNIDMLASKAVVGMVRTVPESMNPGSDVANLSVMGYDPMKYYTGRSPLETVSMGVKLFDGDISFRCNLVTLSEDEPYENKVMIDYCSGEISSKEAAVLVKYLNEKLSGDNFKFYNGISYRHCMVWNNGENNLNLTPPHDISDKVITDYMPRNEFVKSLMKKSYELLKNHPVNEERIKKGLHPANSIWLWGEGTPAVLPNFKEKYGLSGSVISAVDLVKGIGISAGLSSIDVEGVTGNVDTNYTGKCNAAIDELLINGKDFVYIHVEAPDECGHRGELENKVKSIEFIDKDIVGPLVWAMRKAGEDFSILIMPDHPTPLSVKTHVRDPIPFVLYRSNKEIDSGIKTYNEKTGKSTGIYIDKGYTLMDELLNKRQA